MSVQNYHKSVLRIGNKHSGAPIDLFQFTQLMLAQSLTGGGAGFLFRVNAQSAPIDEAFQNLEAIPCLPWAIAAAHG